MDIVCQISRRRRRMQSAACSAPILQGIAPAHSTGSSRRMRSDPGDRQAQTIRIRASGSVPTEMRKKHTLARWCHEEPEPGTVSRTENVRSRGLCLRPVVGPQQIRTYGSCRRCDHCRVRPDRQRQQTTRRLFLSLHSLTCRSSLRRSAMTASTARKYE